MLLLRLRMLFKHQPAHSKHAAAAPTAAACTACAAAAVLLLVGWPLPYSWVCAEQGTATDSASPTTQLLLHHPPRSMLLHLMHYVAHELNAT
jgi:hypothetical protein